MIIALVSENFNNQYPVAINNKLAVITYLLRKHIFPVQIKRYFTTKHIATAHYVIDLDTSNKEIMESLDGLLRCKNMEIESYKDYRKKYRLLELFNGTHFRWPIPYSKYISNGLFNILANMTPKEVHSALNPNNINKSLLGHYMKLLYEVRINGKSNNYLINYVEEHIGGDSLSYFKAITAKHKQIYNPGEYIRNKHTIDLILDVLGDHTQQEYDRNTLVRLSNELEIGHCTKDIGYYLVRDGLEHTFVYSIYKHKYTDDKTGKVKHNVLINIIANKDEVSKSKINKVKIEARRRYPKLRIHTRVQWLRKR